MAVVPGNVPEYLEKSGKLDTDVLIFDLQDAIANTDVAKHEARALVACALRKRDFRARELCIRVNNPDSPWIRDDIKAAAEAGADSITVSRAHSASEIRFVEDCLASAAPTGKLDIIVEVDTAGMLADLDNLATTSTAVTGLQVAAYDYALEIGARVFGPDRVTSLDFLNHCRDRVLVTARARGWNAGDLVDPTMTTPDGVKAAMHASRGIGFDGVALVFPRFVPIANEVYGVSAAELAWAQALVAGWMKLDDGPDRNKGYRMLDGVAVFTPAYEYARRVLTYHAVISGDSEASRRFRERGLASDDYRAKPTQQSTS
jgi:citrate lyase subunit beta/citryl-CoA lyase